MTSENSHELAKALMVRYHILTKFQQTEAIELHFDLTNETLPTAQLPEILKYLRQAQQNYLFKLNMTDTDSLDLVVTDKLKKMACVTEKRPKTWSQVYRIVESKYNITTSAQYKHNPEDTLTESEFQKAVGMYAHADEAFKKGFFKD